MVPNPKKRSAVNELTKKFGDYLHLGRHVAEPGTPDAGTFPVNHVDAGFAIATMKVMLSYAATLTEQAMTSAAL